MVPHRSIDFCGPGRAWQYSRDSHNKWSSCGHLFQTWTIGVQCLYRFHHLGDALILSKGILLDGESIPTFGHRRKDKIHI